MRSMSCFLSLALCSLLAASAERARTVPAGVYVGESDAGTLNVEPSGRFTLETKGANGHSCDVEATLAAMTAQTSEGCRITFFQSLDRVTVSADSDTAKACRSHCGTRASIEGDFYLQVPECRDNPVQAERQRFSELSANGQHREAA